MNLKNVTKIAEQLCTSRGWAMPEYIDHGASAAVYKTETETGLAALKIYDPTYFEGVNALIETKRIELQLELRGHPCQNLVQVYDAGAIIEHNTWFLLMEFCPWKSLDKRLAEIPDDNIHAIIKQLATAVRFLEESGLVHRDIKPANIVISDDLKEIKLLDFGVMRKIAHDEGSGTDGYAFIATAQYSPPEFLLREEAPGEKGFSAINVYQIGAVLHDLITKTPIFGEEKSTKNRFKLFKAVTEKNPRVVSAQVAPRLIAICIAALHKDPAARTSGVTLDDFLSDADNLDDLRRRVRRGKPKADPTGQPSLMSWHDRVRSWGRDAAQLEVEALGAVTMKTFKADKRRYWEMAFANTDVTIILDLQKLPDSLAVRVASTPNMVNHPIIFYITADGPDLPEAGIPSVLAGQYLYAIDDAMTRSASALTSDTCNE